MKQLITNKKILLMGLAFKPGTDDIRGSASIYIIYEIIKMGGKVKVYDPKAMENAKLLYFKDMKNQASRKIRICADIDDYRPLLRGATLKGCSPSGSFKSDKLVYRR